MNNSELKGYLNIILNTTKLDNVISLRNSARILTQYCAPIPISDIDKLTAKDVFLSDGMLYLVVDGYAKYVVLKYNEAYYNVLIAYYNYAKVNLHYDQTYFPEIDHKLKNDMYPFLDKCIDFSDILADRCSEYLPEHITPKQIREEGLNRALLAATNFNEVLAICQNAKFCPSIFVKKNFDFKERRKILLGINFDIETDSFSGFPPDI